LALAAVILLSLGVYGCARSGSGERPQSLPKAAITIAGRSLEVEIASTNAQRQIGMMHRLKLTTDEGMLFIFPDVRERNFYMKNTHVALSIAFIAADGRIINIAHMEPLTLKIHSSRLPAMYALEMPLGWFDRNNVREGDRVGIPETLKAADEWPQRGTRMGNGHLSRVN